MIRLSDEFQVMIVNALESVGNYGSIEMYIQNGKITQITTRHIQKTDISKNDRES